MKIGFWDEKVYIDDDIYVVDGDVEIANESVGVTEYWGIRECDPDKYAIEEIWITKVTEKGKKIKVDNETEDKIIEILFDRLSEKIFEEEEL